MHILNYDETFFVCLLCRTRQPQPALRSHGSDPDTTAGLGAGTQLLLLARADLQRRLLLQAAHQERRLKESGRGRDPGVHWGRGLQLNLGLCVCVRACEKRRNT